MDTAQKIPGRPICRRIEMVKKVFMEKKKLFTGKMNLELKKRIMKCLVWSVAQTWALMQTDRRLETFVMQIWRRMEKSTDLINLLMRKLSES